MTSIENFFLLGQTKGAAYPPVLTDKARAESVERLDNLFFRYCAMMDANILFECGCYDAETSIKFLQNRVDSTAFAFEASPEVFREVSTATVHDRLRLFNIALGASDGNVKYYFNPRKKLAKNGSLLKRKDREQKSCLVRMRTLDACVRDLQLDIEQTKIALWIDVEGVALSVLQGATKLLSSTAIIKVEVERKPLWRGQHTEDEIHDFLQQKGFTLVEMDFEYQDQHNLLYVRSSLLNLLIGQ